MSLGLVATAIACIKIPTFGRRGDTLRTTIYSSMLAKIEEQVGIIAACLPCLKSPAERALRRMGILGEVQNNVPDLTYIQQTAPSPLDSHDPERAAASDNFDTLDPKPSPSVSSGTSDGSASTTTTGGRGRKEAEVQVTAV